MNPYELGNRVSTFNFFKNYNSLVATSGTETVLPEQYTSKLQFTLPHHHQSCLLHSSAYLAEEKALKACISTPLFRPMVRNVFTSDAVKLKLLDVFGGNFSEANHSNKRQRSEKKRIPEEQKDEKYFERRKRNNQAAKKSRDARKLREDQVALRAAVLEHENAILKTQVLTLQEETASLRHLLYQKKAFDLHGGEIRS